VKKLKSANIWHSYKQERGCLVHFAHLVNTLLKDEVGGDQMYLVPVMSKTVGDASHNSHRVVVPNTWASVATGTVELQRLDSARRRGDTRHSGTVGGDDRESTHIHAHWTTIRRPSCHAGAH